MSLDNGGPTYPQKIIQKIVVPDEPISEVQVEFEGMSLRDHYAGLAMQALINDRDKNPFLPETDCESVANRAFEIADYMLFVKKHGEF